MALDAKVQADADAALDKLVDDLRSRQAGVKGSTGRYRQVLADGPWGTWTGIKPDAGAVAARVDEYRGPSGDGWVVVGEVNGHLRQINVGPETWRGQDWQAL